MQGTHGRFIVKFSSPFLLFLLFSPILPVSASPKAFFLAAIISVEIIKTNTIFCIIFLETLDGVISSSMIIEVLNLGYVFAFLLDGISINFCCRRVITTTLFLALLALRTSLVFLVFFTSLALVGSKL